MIDSLFSAQIPILIVLALAAIIALSMYRNSQKRSALIAVVVIGVLAVLFLGLGFLITTESERVESSVQKMMEAFNKKDLDSMFNYVSDQFNYRGADKARLRGRAQSAINDYGATNLRAWDVEVTLDEQDEKKANVSCKVKIDLPRAPKFIKERAESTYVEMEMSYQKEGEIWRMTSFKLFQSIPRREISIPGLP